MSNMVVIDGNELKFNPLFGPNTVTPIPPLRISGSGEASIGDKKICILGDEKKVSISATYTKTTHQIPGKGTLTITQLAPDQRADFATAQTAVIVVGSQFTAQFKPEAPAMDPQIGEDPDKSTAPGTGQFINSQSFVTAG